MYEFIASEITGYWQLALEADLEWREWDGDYVVYCGLDGATHLLEEASAVVFSQLSCASEPIELGKLAASLLAHCTPETTAAEVNEVLGEVLSRFRRIGIAGQSGQIS